MFWGQKWFSHETISHWSFGPNVIDYGRLARRLSVGSLTHFAAIPGIAGRMGDQKCTGGQWEDSYMALHLSCYRNQQVTSKAQGTPTPSDMF